MACDDATTADAALLAAVSGPAETSVDGVTVRSHSLPDLIAAHKYLTGLCAANSRTRGLRFNALNPGGTVYARRWSPGVSNGWGFDRWRDY